MEYRCDQCGMSVKGLTCGECDSELEQDVVRDEQGHNVSVCKCPSGCGMIKTPECCDHEMTAKK